MNAVEKANMTEQKSVSKSLNKKKSKNKKNHQQNQQQLEKLNETVKQSLPPAKIKISSEKNVYDLNSNDEKTITTALNGVAVNGELDELTSAPHINENGCIDTSKSDKNLSSSSLSNESGIMNGKASTSSSSSPQQNQSSKGHTKKNNTNIKSPSSSSSLSMQSNSSVKMLDLQSDQEKINKQKFGKNELPSSHIENHENINNRLTKKNKKSRNKSAAVLTETTIAIENSQNNTNVSKNKHKNSNTNKSTKKPKSKLYTVSNSGELLSSINLEVNDVNDNDDVDDDDDDDDDEDGDNIDDDIENDKNLLENKIEPSVDDKKEKNKNITNILSLSSPSSSNQYCKKTASNKKIDCIVEVDIDCHHNNLKIDKENADNLEEMKKIEHQNDNNNSDDNSSSSKNNNNDNNENVKVNSSNSNTNSTITNDNSSYTTSEKDKKLNLPNYIEPCSSSSSSLLLKRDIEEASNLAVNDDSLSPSPSSSIDRSNIVIEYKEYESELQMQDIMRLIQTELSEPYSIYTYRYFIYNWPKLCFLAAHGDEYVGAIVCKLDMHMNVKRGYIAMLAVKKEYRKLRIGTNLVQKAIEAMLADNADEVVLETEMKNIPALRLYENLGFVRDKRLFRYYLNGVDALRLKLWFR